MKQLIEKFKMYGFNKFVLYSFVEIKRFIVMILIKGSYSQQGEDLIIDKLLGYKKSGFYVDVGANNPNHFSNTKRFYKKGWRGINIEPDLNNFQKFKDQRKRDINLNCGIATTNSKLTFYKFFPDTLSTFSKSEANKYKKQGYKLQEKKDVEVQPLSDVLSQYCKKGNIDFFSVDTEGFDLDVLKSNDWNKFKPKLICIESVSHDLNNINNKKKDDHELFLCNVGYKKIYDNGLNSIFAKNLERVSWIKSF